jgi:CitMHS family citrate-Mg2+:H+ or citrate-Ca2+:H+ symporter
MDPVFTTTIIYALVMAGAYAFGYFMKYSVEICLFFAVVAGGLVAGAGLDLFRHMAEGSALFLDIGLIFVFATLFMNIIKATGGTEYIVRGIIKTFHKSKTLLLIFLMAVILVPGALTGAGSISVLVVGGTVASALVAMGLERKTVAAIIFIVAGLSAVAPPVNVWAMMACAGTALPYVGFTWPLLVPVLILGLFTVLFLGRKGKITDVNKALADIPEPKDFNVWGTVIPFALLIVLLAAPRIWPFGFPVLGLPLTFAICAFVAWVMNFKKIKIVKVTRDTVDQLIPLVATVVVIGMLIQIMSFNGTKGLLSLGVVTAPMILLYFILPIVIPLSEGLFAFGGAVVLGIPLVWMFNARGINPVIALSGLSLLWALGDAMPPTKLIARLTVDTIGYKGKYNDFLKSCAVPWIVITAVGILMIAFSNELAFLMG